MRLTNRIFVFLFFVCFATFYSSFIYGEQDVWLIDTQSASWNRASEAEFAKIKYLRFQSSRWESVGADEFAASQDFAVPLIVFAPGYTSTASNTIEVGLGITRLIKTDKPYRMVLWNWPSQQVVHGLRPDIRAKIPVAAANGQYLARFLRSLKPQSKVCLLGFSFGNRIIADAGVLLGTDRPENMQIRMVMASPAMDQNGLAEGSKYAELSNLIEKTLILYNPNDFRLSFYPFLYGHKYRTDALGLNGPSPAVRQKFGDRLEAIDVEPYIGIRHKTLIVLNTPPFRQRIKTYLLFE